MRAKFYIYRNLNRGKNFSVKYRGKVIKVREGIEAYDVEFRVSSAGRERVLSQGKRNVHAYAVARDFASVYSEDFLDELNMTSADQYVQSIDRTVMVPVWYNPFKASQFRAGDIDIFKADYVLFVDGKCFVHQGSVPCPP